MVVLFVGSMANVDGKCEYVFDPENPEIPDRNAPNPSVAEELLNEEGVWRCPHDTAAGADLCIFHLPVSEKDDTEVVEEFLAVVEEATADDNPSDQPRTLQFLGA